MIRLYIADIDAAFIASVRAAVSRSRAIQMIGSSESGKKALDDVIRLRPDVLITGIALPGLDGIALLRECRRLRNPPSVIVCTAFYSEISIECACKYGASLFLCKPIDIDGLPCLVMECAKTRSQPPAQGAKLPDSDMAAHTARVNAARALLKEIGISPRLDGYAYLIESIACLRGQSHLLKNLSHGLYAELARRMDTTVSRVERSLRCAVNIAYTRGALSRHFPRRPTNKEFLEYISSAVDEREER